MNPKVTMPGLGSWGVTQAVESTTIMQDALVLSGVPHETFQVVRDYNPNS